jgi:hypothetical protein
LNENLCPEDLLVLANVIAISLSEGKLLEFHLCKKDLTIMVKSFDISIRSRSALLLYLFHFIILILLYKFYYIKVCINNCP